MTHSNSLSPANPGIAVALVAEQSVRQQLRNVAAHLMDMPPIEEPQIPDLAANIDAVRTHASMYFNNLSGEMDEVYRAIIRYGQQLQNTNETVLDMLKANPGSAVVAKAQSMLKEVLQLAAPVDTLLQRLTATIATFDGLVNGDARNLLGDQAQAQRLLMEDRARLCALNQQMEGLEQQLAYEQREEIIIGIFTLGIGALIMELEHTLQDAEQAIQQVYRQTDMLGQQMSQLGATANALGGFANGTALLSGLAQCLLRGWQTLNASLSEVTQQTVPPAFLVATVNTVSANWVLVLKEVAQLQPVG